MRRDRIDKVVNQSPGKTVLMSDGIMSPQANVTVNENITLHLSYQRKAIMDQKQNVRI